jgi:ribosomal protein S18 acetylase RimI-like enzyme
MSPHLTIRGAIPDDEEPIAALWQACGLVTSYNDPAEDLRFARGKSNSDVLVGIDDDGKLVGSVMVGHDGHRGWIYYVAADPNYRKQGIGRRMMEAAEKWLKARKVVKMMLLVRDTNTQVVDFYKRLDFETIPRVIMQKWLRPVEQDRQEFAEKC